MPKHKKALETMFTQFFQTAKDNLQKDGYLIPCVFLLKGGHEDPEIAGMVEMKFQTDEDKDEIAKRIEELIRNTGAWGYVLVNEVWLLAADDFPSKGLPTGTLPSSHPKRREAVWVALFTYDYHRGCAALFKREDKNIVFTKEIAMQPDHQFAGRFAGMLPPMN